MYATVNDFRTKYFDIPVDILQNIDGSRSDTDDSAIVAALVDASGEIDAILGVRYRTPISPISEYLVNACRVIARKNLDHDGSESIRLAYLDVIERLISISTGESVLPAVNGLTPPPVLSGKRRIVASQPINQRTSDPKINFRGTLPRDSFLQ